MRTATIPAKWKASASKKLEYETRKNTAVSMTGSVFKLANLVISAFTKPQQLPIRQEPNRIQQKCPKPLTRLSASNLLFMAYISICLCKKELSNIAILCRSTFWGIFCKNQEVATKKNKPWSYKGSKLGRKNRQKNFQTDLELKTVLNMGTIL